jgi:hypothetical protein
MFLGYDVASTDDKLDALRLAREYAETRKAIENVTAFPTERAHDRAHGTETAGVSEGIWLGGRDSNPARPQTPATDSITASESDSKRLQ